MFERFKKRDRNVGDGDFYFRMIMGVIMLVIGSVMFFEHGNIKGLLFYIGILPVVTALMKWCPMYYIFGISSCKLKNR